MIARAADGSMRDALSLTDQVLAMGDGKVTADRVRDALGLVPEDEFLTLLDIILDRRAGDVFTFVARLADAGIDFSLFLSGFADIVRAQLAILLGGEVPDLPDRARAALEERRSRWSAPDLLRMLSAIGELEPRFRKSGQQQLLIETLLVRFALLDRTVEIEDLLRGLSGDGGEMSPSRPARPASRPAEPPRGRRARAGRRPATRLATRTAAAAGAVGGAAVTGARVGIGRRMSRAARGSPAGIALPLGQFGPAMAR